MDKLEKQFNKMAHKISLSDKEKGDMRSAILSYMEYKPIREPIVKTKNNGAGFHFFRLHHFSGAFMVAVLVMTSSFGVSFAADEALPGDLLYGVKVNINEEIKTVFLSEDELLAWERERAERRLEEASRLVSEGRLDDKKREKVSKLFEEHTKAVVEHVLESEKTDPVFAAEVTSEFKDSLDAHEAVLAVLAVQNGEDGADSAKDLIKQVQTATMEVEKIQNDAEEKIDINSTESNSNSKKLDNNNEKNTDLNKTNSANLRERATYRAKERAVESEKEANDLLDNIQKDSDLFKQAKKQMDFGEDLLNVADENINDNKLNDAYNNYRDAATSFQKVSQLLQVAKMFSIEIYPDINSTSTDISKEPFDDSGNNLENNNSGAEIQKTKNSEMIEKLNHLHGKIEGNIKKARMRLLEYEGYNKKDVENVNKHIKNASAYLLRGEIAMLLEDYLKAEELYNHAFKMSERALYLIDAVSNGVEKINISSKEKKETVDNLKFEGKTVMIEHEYRDGVHVFKGEINVDSSCSILKGDATVASGTPQNININLTTDIFNELTDKKCVQVSTNREFSLSVNAPQEAVLSKIFIDGKEINWEEDVLNFVKNETSEQSE